MPETARPGHRAAQEGIRPSWSEILAQIEAIVEAYAAYVSIDYADAEDESCALFYRAYRNATGDRAERGLEGGESECT